MIVNEADCATPRYVAVIVTTTVALTALVLAVKVPVVDPADTVTLPGTEAEELLPCNEITAPPLGATPFSVTVPVTLLPPVVEGGFSAIDAIDGGLTVIVDDMVLTVVAEMLTGVDEETPCEVIANVEVVSPGDTITCDGTLATAVFPDDKKTVTPAGPAGTAIDTVPAAEFPPITAVGDMTTDCTLGGLTVNPV